MRVSRTPPNSWFSLTEGKKAKKITILSGAIALASCAYLASRYSKTTDIQKLSALIKQDPSTAKEFLIKCLQSTSCVLPAAEVVKIFARKMNLSDLYEHSVIPRRSLEVKIYEEIKDQCADHKNSCNIDLIFFEALKKSAWKVQKKSTGILRAKEFSLNCLADGKNCQLDQGRVFRSLLEKDSYEAGSYALACFKDPHHCRLDQNNVFQTLLEESPYDAKDYALSCLNDPRNSYLDQNEVFKSLLKIKAFYKEYALHCFKAPVGYCQLDQSKVYEKLILVDMYDGYDFSVACLDEFKSCQLDQFKVLTDLLKEDVYSANMYALSRLKDPNSQLDPNQVFECLLKVDIHYALGYAAAAVKNHAPDLFDQKKAYESLSNQRIEYAKEFARACFQVPVNCALSQDKNSTMSQLIKIAE